MKAEIAVMTAENIDEDAIRRGGEILKNGGLVAFPTETVYGLGGNALDPKASMKIYAAKGRPSDNPLIVHIADIRDLDKIVTEVPEKARILAEKYWPGPLTMILPKADIVPKETTGGLDSVAVRFPSDPIAQELILAAGGRASCEECCDTTVLQAAQNQRIWILACADESNDRVDHQCDKEHGSHQYTDQTAIA